VVPDGWFTVVISLVGAVTGAFGVELVRQFAARGERRMSFDERQREQLAARVLVLEGQVDADRKEYDRRMDQARMSFESQERLLNRELDGETSLRIRSDAQLSLALREVQWWRRQYPEVALPFIQADDAQFKAIGTRGLLPSQLPPDPVPPIAPHDEENP
jgi:hypothetical protein